MSGTFGQVMRRECALSASHAKPTEPTKLQILLEATRRANWDGLSGPQHLRTGEFEPHGTKRPVDARDNTQPKSVGVSPDSREA